MIKCKMESVFGKDIKKYIDTIGEFRIQNFREYPYLYDGNLKYERRYIAGFSHDKEAHLVLLKDAKGKIWGVSTALPMKSDSEILEGTAALFKKHKYNPKQFFYYGEIILHKKLHGKGFSRMIYNEHEKAAKDFGYSKASILTVLRSKKDPRRPAQYKEADPIWKALGFKKTKIKTDYSWPTIQKDGSTKEALNLMVFWVKNYID